MEQHIFKIGDIVKCNISVGFISYGKSYKVIKINSNNIYIVNDAGYVNDYHFTRFDLDLITNRNNVIDEILN